MNVLKGSVFFICLPTSFWRNKANTLINESKQVYYQNAIKDKQNTGAIWTHLNELNTGKRTNNYPSKLKINNETFLSGDDIANKFNEYFTNIYKNLPGNTDSPNLEKLKDFVKQKILII